MDKVEDIKCILKENIHEETPPSESSLYVPDPEAESGSISDYEVNVYKVYKNFGQVLHISVTGAYLHLMINNYYQRRNMTYEHF